jgi:hypothetical protein
MQTIKAGIMDRIDIEKDLALSLNPELAIAMREKTAGVQRAVMIPVIAFRHREPAGISGEFDFDNDID